MLESGPEAPQPRLFDDQCTRLDIIL